jgi:ADP-dependent phosphofructokinase/glucokinase
MGLGGTVDYEIELSEKLIANLISKWSIKKCELGTELKIDSERNILLVILAFIKNGLGGERFVEKSIDLIKFSQRFEKKITLGGTCVRAALALEPFGISTVLHLVSMSDEVRQRLPKKSKFICSAEKDTLDPHLIIQYPKGFKIKIENDTFTASKPSRIIFTNDPPNRELVISEELGDELSNASVFLVSGFNCIQDDDVLNSRLNEIERHIKKLPEKSIIYFEDAEYHIPRMSKKVQERLACYFDIYSMNEDELQNYLNTKINLFDPDEVKTSIYKFNTKINFRNLVIHTQDWSLVYGEDAIFLQNSLQSGIDLASARFKFGDGFSKDNFIEIKRRSKSRPGVIFAKQINEIFDGKGICLPGYELKVLKPTTIGLGDAFVGGFIGSLINKI